MALAKTKSVSIGTPIHIYEGTLDLASVGAADGVEQALACTGLSTDDVILAFNATEAFIDLGIGNVRISAADEFTVTFVNPTAGAIDAAGTIDYQLVVLKRG